MTPGRSNVTDGRRADAGLGQVQLVAAKILGRSRIGRSAEEGEEVLDVTDIVVFSTNLRTVMSSIMRRRSGLMAISVIGVLLS